VLGPSVAVPQGFPVVGGPARIADLGVEDPLVVLSFDVDGNGEPVQAVRRFDLIAVAPIAACILHLVVENELVAGGDQVEIAFPRNIVRLDDGHGLG